MAEISVDIQHRTVLKVTLASLKVPVVKVAVTSLLMTKAERESASARPYRYRSFPGNSPAW